MDKVKKYLLYALLLENISVQTLLAGTFAKPLFYIFIVIGFFFILQKDFWHSAVQRMFWPLYLLGGVYVLYQFSFGLDYLNQQSVIYLSGKIATFAIIIICIKSNYEFYENRMLNGLTLFMCFFILYGFATGGGAQGTDRMTVGFTNENTTSGMGALVLGTMLFSVQKWNKKALLIAGIGLYALLAGGSRAGMMVLGILMIMRYGLTPKIVFISALLVIVSVYVLPSIGFETVGVQRVVDTINGTEGTNRDMEREAAWMMIEERPINGWGFEAQNQGAALDLSELGSHNGYLETLKYMGYIMGGLWIAALLFFIIKALLIYKKKRIPYDIYLAILVAFAANAFFEGLFVGVHEFATNMFFVALAMVYSKIYRIKMIL